MNIIRKFLGIFKSNFNQNLKKVVRKILEFDEEMSKLTDTQLQEKTNYFREKLANNVSLMEILPEAFAVAREAANRILNLKAYPVQLMGAYVLHTGDVAEMRTGEGKTLTALMPTYLNALTGKGVHIVTVNEYLAQRDAEINGEVLIFLGISVGVSLNRSTNIEKRDAYSCDVTYTTNSELGFDYLRDNMVARFEQKVQRPLNYAIIDEADSVLIDESRTPLIISGGSKNRTPLYQSADKFAKSLNRETDVKLDLESKQAALTPEGVKKAEKFFKLKNLFAFENSELYHHILNALKAVHVFVNGVEYVVYENEIVLVDQFTGRMMQGRAYSDGLQQAIQAKEEVDIEQETTTLATITYQNFFRLYSKLSGMTGTAKTEEEEFIKIYNMRVIKIPTNKPIIRRDENDLVFATQKAKYKALMKEIIERNTLGQPILIGTSSVTTSEAVSELLTKANLKHNVLNAKNHAREAEIIANAGEKYGITIATNMAGRGTDIKLGSGVVELGGLAVLATERNEARRIDNQLRGRSGRQGDPGFSRFYISIEDDLMLRFGSQKLQGLFAKLGDDHIQSRLLSRSITNAQKKVEGLNFDMRKNLLDYDNVLAQQREVMYKQRDIILQSDNFNSIIERMTFTVAEDLLNMFKIEVNKEIDVDYEKLVLSIKTKLVPEANLVANKLSTLTSQQVITEIGNEIYQHYLKVLEQIDGENTIDIQRTIIIEAFDHFWTSHIDESSRLRTGIYLRSYAQSNPLHAYIDESAHLFERMRINIAHQVIISLCNLEITDTNNDNIIPQDVLDAIQKTRLKQSA